MNALSFILIIAALAVVAADSPWDSIFVAAYIDPNHPDCARAIMPYDSTTSSIDFPTDFYTSGADNINGEGYSCHNVMPPTLDSWGPLPTSVNGTSIIVDFSSKGGPSNLTGQWKEYSSEKMGILWEDVNFWEEIQHH